MAIDKIQIVMNEAKIEAEGKYNIQIIMHALDELFVGQLGMKKEGVGTYAGSGASQDLAKLGKGTVSLSKCGWFAENLISMDYFEINEDDPSWNTNEDWKAGIIDKRRKIA